MKQTQATQQQNGGMSLSTVFLVNFVVLKLTGLVDWSWWWVLSPLWIQVMLLFIIATLAATAAAMRDGDSK